MDLQAYFENAEGMGILSTADTDGNVDSAIYAAPHIMSEDTIAFIMRPRRSFQNVDQNPKAVYMFIEKGPGYQGRRLYLEKTKIESDPAIVSQYRRTSHGHSDDEGQSRLVYFQVQHVRPLVGDKEES